MSIPERWGGKKSKQTKVVSFLVHNNIDPFLGGKVSNKIAVFFYLIASLVFTLEANASCPRMTSKILSGGNITPEVLKEYASCESTNVENPKFVVFLLHGLTGDTSTFGDLKYILESRYGGLAAVPLSYPTGNGQATIFHFSNIIYSKVVNYFHLAKLPSDTPYGFIVHSQGGVVATNFLLQCIGKSKRSEDSACSFESGARQLKKYAKKVEQGIQADSMLFGSKPPQDLHPTNVQFLMTLGTPHHGSAKSTAVTNTWYGKMVAPIAGLPYSELEGMSYGNIISTVILQTLEGIGNRNKFGMPDGVHIYNVAGDIRNPARKMKGDSQLKTLWKDFVTDIKDIVYHGRELDIAVDAPDARFDYIKMENNGESRLIQYADTYTVVDLPHMVLPMETGIAKVFASCGASEWRSGLEKKADGAFKRNAKNACYKYHPGYLLINQQLAHHFEDYGVAIRKPIFATEITEDDLYSHTSNRIAPVLPLKRFSVQLHLDTQGVSRSFYSLSQLKAAWEKQFAPWWDIRINNPFRKNWEALQKVGKKIEGYFGNQKNASLESYNQLKSDFIRISPNRADEVESTFADQSIASVLNGVKAYEGHKATVFFHQGVLRDKLSFAVVKDREVAHSLDELKKTWLNYKILIPGWKARSIDLPVAATYNTIADVKLEPFQPYVMPEDDDLSRIGCYVGVVGRHQKSHKGIAYSSLLAPKVNVRVNGKSYDRELLQDKLVQSKAMVLPELTFVKVQRRFKSDEKGYYIKDRLFSSGSHQKDYYDINGERVKTPIDRYRVEIMSPEVANTFADSFGSTTAYLSIKDVDVLDPKLFPEYTCDNFDR